MKKRLAISMMVIVTFLAACSTSDDKKDSGTEGSSQTKVLNVGIESELSTADVSLAMDNTANEVMLQVAEGLYSFDQEGEAVPAVAKELVEPTNDGKTYTFKLREDAKWSNGDPVTAHDFEYAWKRTVTPATASPQAYYFEGLENYDAIENGEMDPNELGVKALDDYTLEVNLAYPMSYFPQLLAVAAYFPLNEAFVTEKGDVYGTSSEDTLYNGAFNLEDWNGSNITWKYTKNDYYWDKDNVALDEVNVQVVKENATGANMFEAGGLDYVKITGELVAHQQDNPALTIRSIPGTYYLELNSKSDVFSNKNARKAIEYVTDSESIATQVLNDGSKKALGFVPTGFVNPETKKDFAEEVGDINPYDVDKAKEFWETAKKELNISEVEVEILCSDTENAKKLAEYVQGATSELEGLKVKLTAVPFNNRLEKSRSGDFDMVIGGWTPVYADPVDFLNLLHSGNGNNFGQFSNEKMDQLIDAANTTYAADVQKRWEVMQEADKIISEEAPLISLYQISEAYLVNENVKGLEFGPLGSTYFKNGYFE